MTLSPAGRGSDVHANHARMPPFAISAAAAQGRRRSSIVIVAVAEQPVSLAVGQLEEAHRVAEPVAVEAFLAQHLVLECNLQR